MGKAKLHDNSDENKRFSPKCGSKTIDLGKSRSVFAQMWVKNHRFGQKVQQEGTHADSGRRARSMLFHALPVAVPLSLAAPPIPHLPSPPKKGVFPEIENVGLLCIKVPYFCLESSDVLPIEVRCFHFPERHLSALPPPPFTPEGRGQGRKPEGKREQKRFFSRPQKKTKTRVKDGKPALFASFFLGIPQKHPNFTHRFYRRPSGGFFPGTPYPMDTCRRQSPAQQDRRPLHPMRKLWKTSRTSTKRHRSCLPSTGPLPH